MLNEAFLQKLDALRLAFRAPAQGGAGGLRRSRALGTSVEFSDFREYAPGDDLRRIDWNAYARFDRLFLKLFMEEQETHVHILLDASASMAADGKFELAQNLAQMLAYLALRGGDRVTIATLNGEIRPSPALSGRTGMLKAAEFLRELQPAGELKLCQAVPRVPLANRGMAILITDLMSPDGYEKTLQSLQYRRQEASLLHVLSPWEMEPRLEGMVRLRDSETGEERELTASVDLLAAYQKALHALLHGAEGFCRSRGMQYLRLLSDLDVEKEALRALAAAGLIG